MGKNNKSIKDAMIKKYGRKCFIEELGLRTKEEIERDLERYKKSKHKELCMLTYHHIRERCRGGDASEENGAILRNINHIWFNGLSRKRQQEINNLFQEYKLKFIGKGMLASKRPARIIINIAELNSGRVVKANSIILPNVGVGVKAEESKEKDDVLVIPAYPVTEAEYNKYIAQRREQARVKWQKLGHEIE